MHRTVTLGLLLALTLFSGATGAAQVRHVSVDGMVLSVCNADLGKDVVRTFWRADSGEIFGTLANLAATQRAKGRRLVCAVNGGIFEATRRPLGLYVENGRTLRRLNTRKHAYGNFYMEPNGVFAVHSGRAEIVTTDAFAARTPAETATVRFATQSGPILIENSVINPLLTPGSINKTTRNAVCLRSPTGVTLVMARSPVNFYDFALALKTRLGCTSALYLDGSVSDFFPSAGISLSPPLGPLLGVIGH